MHARIKRLTIGVKKDIKNTRIEDKMAQLLYESDEQRTKWKEYVEELYDKDGKPDWTEMNIEEDKELNEYSLGHDILRSKVVEAIDSIKLNKRLVLMVCLENFTNAWKKIF